MHPGGMLGIYSVDKITRLHDGIEQLEMDNWDMQGDEHMDRMDEDDGMWDDEEMDSDTMVADSDWETDAYANTDVGMDAEDVALEVPQSNTALPAETPHPKPEHSRSKDVDWKQFDVQTSVPIDHAFRNTTPAQPSRSFLSRIQREYRAFITGLPGKIPSCNFRCSSLTSLLRFHLRASVRRSLGLVEVHHLRSREYPIRRCSIRYRLDAGWRFPKHSPHRTFSLMDRRKRARCVIILSSMAAILIACLKLVNP